MINGTNLLRKHNPRCPAGDVTESITFLLIAQPGFAAPRGGRRRGRLPGLPRLTRFFRRPDWLDRLTRRAGTRLFARNDAEARWRHWEITELRGSLARRYRDRRFDALRSLRDVAAQMSAQINPTCPKEQDGPLR